LSKNGEIFPGIFLYAHYIGKAGATRYVRKYFHICCVKQSQTLSVEKSLKNEYVNKLFLNDGSFSVGKHS
jgi:hypothetical protein